MRRMSKGWLTEAWAFLAIAVIAFVAGLLIGDLGSSPKTETIHVSGATEAAEASTPEAGGGSATGAGAAVFADNGCGNCHTLAAAGSTGEVGPNLEESLASDDDTAGIEEMIVKPNVEVIEGYSGNVMPQDYGESLSPTELHELSEFLVESTPAKP